MPTPLLAHSNIKIHTLAPDFIMRLGAFVFIPPHPLFSRTFKRGYSFIFNTVRSTVESAMFAPVGVGAHDDP